MSSVLLLLLVHNSWKDFQRPLQSVTSSLIMEGGSSLSKRGEGFRQKKFLLGEGFDKCMANLYNANSNPTGLVGDEVPSMLGRRGSRYLSYVHLLRRAGSVCKSNSYNAIANPNGCINLGTSENRLVFDLLKDRLTEYNVQWEDYMFTYNDFQGIPELRKATAGFLMDRAKSLSPIDPKQIIIMNGGGVCMEALALVICDPGDGVMVASPYYGGINNDSELRPQCTVVRVHFHSELEEPGQREPFQVMMSKFESVYQEHTAKGVKIKAVFFMNPNNPLGDVCSKQEVLDVLNFCHRHSLHLIMNEVYMNTIFKEGVPHHSVLGLKPEEIPDPEKVHFVWAASKDMSMSGMRFGIIHTLNSDVLACINTLTYFHLIPTYIQKVMARLLSDKDWLNNVYFPTNNKRLREAHKATTDALDEIGVPYLNRPAGLYVYADFRKFLPSVTKENEMAFWYRLITGGVYIAPSQAFYADEQGWFRIIFSRPLDEIKLAMGRIAKTCRDILEENKTTTPLSAASGNDKAGEAGDSSGSAQAASLEGLLSNLKCEISKSDWLQENTADQWKAQNPDLYKKYMESRK